MHMTQGPHLFDTGLKCWPASQALAAFVVTRKRGELSPTMLRGRRVLELGAGCGVAGLGFVLQGAHVTFTDLEHMLPHLRSNVEANLPSDRAGLGSASFAGHRYGDTLSAAGMQPPYDFVIGSDVQCDREANIEPIMSSLRALCDQKSVVVIATMERTGAHIAFYARLREEFGSVKQVSCSTIRRAMLRNSMEKADCDRASALRMVICKKLSSSPARSKRC
jgi:predicted nicotinamide N-methyase